MKLPDGLLSLAISSYCGTGVQERSISTKFRGTVNRADSASQKPFAVPFRDTFCIFVAGELLGQGRARIVRTSVPGPNLY